MQEIPNKSLQNSAKDIKDASIFKFVKKWHINVKFQLQLILGRRLRRRRGCDGLGVHRCCRLLIFDVEIDLAVGGVEEEGD